jgi:hypothetical protein
LGSGYKTGIYFKGSTEHKSYFGTIIAGMAFLVIIIYSIFTLQTVFRKKNYTVTQGSHPSEDLKNVFTLGEVLSQANIIWKIAPDDVIASCSQAFFNVTYLSDT